MANANDVSGVGREASPAKLFDLTGRRVFVAGHRGMVGSAIVRRLAQIDCAVVTADRQEVDLLRQQETERFLVSKKPDVLIMAAAKVGGIHANSTYPAEFIYENLGDRHQPHSRCLPRECPQATIPRLIMHLSKACASADCRRGTSHRTA